MRADPKGDLGKLRSGIPSFFFGVRGRRRAQFPQPEPPISLRVYAGAEAGAQSCWRRASFSGSGGRCKHAVLMHSARGVSDSGWGWEGWRMGFPLPGELRTTTSLPKIPKQKWGPCLSPISAGMLVLEEFDWSQLRSLPKISALGNVFYRSAQRRG